MGVMIESNRNEGNQKLTDDTNNYGDFILSTYENGNSKHKSISMKNNGRII